MSAPQDLPALESERLILRKLRMEDAGDLFEYAQDVELARLGFWKPFDTLEDSRSEISAITEGYERGDVMQWAIEHKQDHRLIGRISLHRYEPDNARIETGYSLNPRYWGKGYATEAVKRAVQFSFEVLQVNRLGAVILAENVASIRVVEKAGLKFEGVRREYVFIGGTYHDMNCYSILRREWA
jgi:[ribosomal protein S5]-alanine N-acetyltransferase